VDYRWTKQAYDPNFAYYRHAFRQNQGWEESLHRLYAGRRSGEIPRPPHNLAQQAQVMKEVMANKRENAAIHQNVNITHAQALTALRPLKEVHNLHATGLATLGKTPPSKPAEAARTIKLEEVAREQRERQQVVAEHQRQLAQERRKAEEKLHLDGGVPYKPATPPSQPYKPSSLPVPQPQSPPQAAHPMPPPHASPKPPALPAIPRPEGKPIPRYEPPKPIPPPKPRPHKEP
jgi:hypothetical protein